MRAGDQLLTCIAVIAALFLMFRIFGMDSEIPEDTVDRLQPLMEITIILTFLVAVVPRWFRRASSNIRTVAMYCVAILSVVLIAVIAPGFVSDMEPSEGKNLMIIIMIAVMTVYLIAAILWRRHISKRHITNDDEVKPKV